MKIIQQVKMQNPSEGTVELETSYDDVVYLRVDMPEFKFNTKISKALLLDFLKALEVKV
jgi:hypothetical protein